jgi:acyl carrier protein
MTEMRHDGVQLEPEVVEAKLRALLAELFPDDDISGVRGDADLRDVVDLDSMAQVDLAVAVERTFGVSIPDEEIGSLTSVDATVRWVVAH